MTETYRGKEPLVKNVSLRARPLHEHLKNVVELHYSQGTRLAQDVSRSVDAEVIHYTAIVPLRYWLAQGTFNPPSFEDMGEEIHAYWCWAHTQHQFVLGSVKNKDPEKGPLTHTDLLSWEDLPQDKKDIDIRLARLCWASLEALQIR